MPNKYTLISAAFFILVIAACKKSNSSGGSSSSNPLTGTWNYTAETSNANISASESIGPISVQVVDVAAIRTINNTGNFVFTADSVSANQVGYMVDTTYTTYTTTGGVTDTATGPLKDTVAPANSKVSYQLIGQDSIYFPNGSLFAVNLNTGQSAQISGAHFTVSGNTLTLTSTIDQTMNETIDGVTLPTTALIKSTITLTKQ
jgi:hypothetical protein